jgi:hypothetical protein
VAAVRRSPVWFTQHGRLPVEKSDPQRWADYLRELAATADAALNPSREDCDKAQQIFREASQIYLTLAEGR